MRSILLLLLCLVCLPIYEFKVPEQPKTHSKLISCISYKYNIPYTLAIEITDNVSNIANYDRFPNDIDLLSIIAIESGFDVLAYSKSGAKGLMQVLYKPTEMNTTSNIQDGYNLLNTYNLRLKDSSASIHAYNIGIGNYKKGMRNKAYLAKFNKTKQNFLTIIKENTCTKQK